MLVNLEDATVIMSRLRLASGGEGASLGSGVALLSLEDVRWGELQHAYGAAQDIPDLLRQLAAAPGPKADWRAEPWFTLWSSLCHQDDVYPASYAAVPHLVRIAIEAPRPVDFSFLLLPACIELARAAGRGPAVPDFLAAAYAHALAALPDAVSAHRHEPWDEAMLKSASAALAVAKGHPRVAEMLVNLDDEDIERFSRGELR